MASFVAFLDLYADGASPEAWLMNLSYSAAITSIRRSNWQGRAYGREGGSTVRRRRPVESGGCGGGRRLVWYNY